MLPATATAVPADGPLKIDGSRPFPAPGVPTVLYLNLAGSADEIELRVYTKSMTCLETLKRGRTPAGWQAFSLAGSVLRQSPAGLYYYVVLAKKGSGKPARHVGSLMVLR